MCDVRWVPDCASGLCLRTMSTKLYLLEIELDLYVDVKDNRGDLVDSGRGNTGEPE